MCHLARSSRCYITSLECEILTSGYESECDFIARKSSVLFDDDINTTMAMEKRSFRIRVQSNALFGKESALFREDDRASAVRGGGEVRRSCAPQKKCSHMMCARSGNQIFNFQGKLCDFLSSITTTHIYEKKKARTRNISA